MNEGPEKRRHKRITRNFTLSVASTEKGPWPSWSLVTAHDLSVGGVTFTCEQPFQTGDRLVFSIQFMDHLIECRGRVVRSMTVPGKTLVDLAAIFEGLSEKDREYIAVFSRRFR